MSAQDTELHSAGSPEETLVRRDCLQRDGQDERNQEGALGTPEAADSWKCQGRRSAAGAGVGGGSAGPERKGCWAGALCPPSSHPPVSCQWPNQSGANWQEHPLICFTGVRGTEQVKEGETLNQKGQKITA